LTFANYFQWESWYNEEKLKPAHMALTLNETSHAKSVKLSFKDKFELENMEAEILKLETKVAELQNISQRPDIISDHKKLSEAHSELAAEQAKLDLKFKRWAELEKMAKG
jgi:ATP-binding cassette subfamily F protein uup